MPILSNAVKALLVAALLMSGMVSAVAEPLKLRIGVQKYGTLVILAERHTLEQKLAPQGIEVEWKEFPAGPQLLEALTVGSIDFGTTGEAPPIFAQAAGSPLVYAGVEPAAPTGEAILVPKDSAIRSVSELKGKRVALNKGSNVHYLLVRALAAAGLTPKDIQPVYLTPADARAAFESGGVEAWAIWDPFLAAAQDATGARSLTDGTGLVANRQFYLASKSFAAAHPELIGTLLEAIGATDAWAEEHQGEVAALLSPRTGIAAPVLAISLKRLGYGVKPLDEDAIAGQQRIADTFLGLGLIPRPVTVRDIVWAPKS
ncbi:MAG TPA: sulfonate ABC transporter substrate-binding protein [Aliidongia sp.]|nr:sulfonate ABC transporter substrate-binding protein [Aliidongia sp.]